MTVCKDFIGTQEMFEYTEKLLQGLMETGVALHNSHFKEISVDLTEGFTTAPPFILIGGAKTLKSK